MVFLMQRGAKRQVSGASQPRDLKHFDEGKRYGCGLQRDKVNVLNDWG